MNRNTKLLALLAAALAAGPAFGQQSGDELEARMIEAEARLVAQEAEVVRQVEVEKRIEADEAEVRMREAERRLAEAARQVADLSMAQLPRMERLERMIRAGRGPVLGIMISPGSEEPVEGVEVLAVTPGGAAEEAGLSAGDVITSVNGEPLTAESGMAANVETCPIVGDFDRRCLVDRRLDRHVGSRCDLRKPNAQCGAGYECSCKATHNGPHVCR